MGHDEGSPAANKGPSQRKKEGTARRKEKGAKGCVTSVSLALCHVRPDSPFSTPTMLQVRWNLKPANSKEKKGSRMLTFDPVSDKRRAHRDFEQHATTLKSTPLSLKRQTTTREALEEDKARAEEERLAKAARVLESPTFDVESPSFDVENSSETMSNIDALDIDILADFGGEDIEYNVETRVTETDTSLEASWYANRHWASALALSPTSTPLSSACRTHLSTLLHEEAAGGSILMMSEDDVRKCGQLFRMPQLQCGVGA